MVRRGAGLAAAGDGSWQPDGTADQLRQILASAGQIGLVLFGWNLGRGGRADDALPGRAEVADGIADSTLTIQALMKALAGGEFGRPVLLALTSGGVWVRPGDRISLSSATLPGLVKTAAAERVAPVVRQVDLPRDRSQWPAAIDAEISDGATSGVVAWRDGERCLACIRPVPPGGRPAGRPAFAGEGFYVITGGLGGIGYEIAQYLLGTFQVRVLIVGRSPVGQGPADMQAERLAALGACISPIDKMLSMRRRPQRA